MKKLAFLMMLVALVVVVMPVSAQAIKITYGETVEGELADAGEASYTFAGAAGDVVVVNFGDFAYEGTLNGASLSIQDSNGTELAASEGFSTTQTYTQLPADGTYTVVATTTDLGGVYTLTLVNAPVLEADAAVEGTLTNEEVNYFSIVTGAPFNLAYARTDGEFHPQVAVKAQGDFGLTDIAVLYGSQLNAGSMDVEPVEETVYLVIVEQALFDFTFSTVSASYSLTFTQ